MSDEIHTRRLVIHDESAESDALHNSQIRFEKELSRVADQLEAMRLQMLSTEDLRELRQFLSNRRAFSAATASLKSLAIWIVAVAAGVTLIWGGFTEAVRAAFHAGGK